jgi:hypothetical protein
MVLKSEYSILTEKCINIIKNNPPDKAINKISNLKKPNCDIFGEDFALKLYKTYSNKSVDYDSEKYANNVSSYKNNIKKNMKMATETYNNMKKK